MRALFWATGISTQDVIEYTLYRSGWVEFFNCAIYWVFLFFQREPITINLLLSLLLLVEFCKLFDLLLLLPRTYLIFMCFFSLMGLVDFDVVLIGSESIHVVMHVHKRLSWRAIYGSLVSRLLELVVWSSLKHLRLLFLFIIIGGPVRGLVRI